MRSDHTSTAKRGVTLAELSVVLALIALVSTMIVSFSITVRAYADKIAGYRTLQESSASYEDVFEFFVSAADTGDYRLTSRSGVKVIAETVDRKVRVTPVFIGDPAYGSCSEYAVGQVLCALDAEDRVAAWLLLYDDNCYASFTIGTSTDFDCEGFADIRYLFITHADEPDGGHPLVRCIISYEIPSVSENKEIGTIDILRATRAATAAR